MIKTIIHILLLVIVAVSPLLYYLIESYIPNYTDKPLIYDIIYLLPYLLFFLAAFLGIRLNQTRIFFITILWLITYAIISQSIVSILGEFPIETFTKSLAIILPIIVILLFAIREGQLIGFVGFLRSLIIVISLGVCLWISNNPSPLTNAVLSARIFMNMESTHLPDLLLLTLGALILFFFLKPDTSIIPFKLATAVVFLPMLFTLNISAGEDGLTLQAKTFNSISFAIMGLIFLHAIYKLYWQKVYIDELTNVANRRAFDEYLHKLGRKYAIAMVDIDHFKKFNDQYGHTEGDNVLRFVAKHLSEQSGAHVFRYGGEEFALIYRGVDVKNIFWLVDHMRERLAKSDFFIRVADNIRKKESAEDRGKKKRKTKKVNVTLSVGLAQRTAALRIPGDVISAADKALYAAKNKGRNICVKARIS